jgi:hypothetical protein
MPSKSASYVSPPIDMVQVVRNIIEGYKMGPIRALAQDPVQNAYDARRKGAVGPVGVEYRLFLRKLPSGRLMRLLTITDRNTTGLRGAALSPEDLDLRAQKTGYLLLKQDENWAAWEAMGYTKAGEDSLGSRGQGKASFLYHSRFDSGLYSAQDRPLERMLILYDTLLEDGTYRLGVRMARPADNVRHPPLEGDEARSVVEGEWEGPDGELLPLGLKPLTEVGTRIIVPHLSQEATDAAMSGELVSWLERCWWRAIQLNELEVTVVVDGGKPRKVGVPSWWVNEPWLQKPLREETWVQEDQRLEPRSRLKVKRIVLTYSAGPESSEIEGTSSAQYAGVQLLRHRQWIETLGSSEKFADFIPPDKRAGFRGFVEFDIALDRELRQAETPQHDAFDRRRPFVKQIDAVVKDAVKSFAHRQGWTSDRDEPAPVDANAKDVLERIVGMFLAESEPVDGPARPLVEWDCELSLDFPDSNSTVVRWGQKLQNITASCRHDPADHRLDVEFALLMESPDGSRAPVASRSRRTSRGYAGVEFGDLVVAKVGKGGAISFPEPGKHRLVLQCQSGGRVVATAARNIYVESTPPTRTTRDVGVDISVRNKSAGRRRINHGEALDITVTVSNRTTDDLALRVNASAGDLLLADEEPIHVPGRPDGDVPSQMMLRYPNVTVFSRDPGKQGEGLFVILAPGRQHIRADVLDSNGTIIASATRVILVEVDETEGGGGLPYDVKPWRDQSTPHAIWELEEPHGELALWTLWYARRHPSYLAAHEADRRRPSTEGLYGGQLFWAETHCGALIEWALREYGRGDEGGFKLLMGRATGRGELWARYETKLEDLVRSCGGDSLEFTVKLREVEALMLYLISAHPR